MPRKRKEQSDNYNKAFPKSIRELMEKRKTTQNELADYLQKTRQAVSYYCDGSSSPDWETLVKIADYFDVSTDYLLGRTADPNRLPCAADDLGLSAEAIHTISVCKNISFYEDAMEGMNLLLTQGMLLFLASRINLFCKAVDTDLELTKVYEQLTKDGNSPKLKRLADEYVAQKEFEASIKSQHPELIDHFEVRFGYRYITGFRRDLVDDFEEMLRNISNYDAFQASHKITPE